MQEVWILTKSSSKCFGQGDYGTVIELACRGAYGSDGPHPAFKSKTDALMYLNSLQYESGHEAVRLLIHGEAPGNAKN